MSGESILTGEAVENLLNQMHDLYLEDALNERDLDESELRKAQIIFFAPFKDGQFNGIRGGDSAVEVRINEEVEVIIRVEVDPDSDIEAGDLVHWSDIKDFGEVIEIPDFGTDVGHITFLWLPDNQFFAAVDFIYNESYIGPLIEAAGEFLEAATHAHKNRSWRSFVETALHAAERMMKAHVIQHGDPAYNHHIVEMNYRKYVEADVGNPELLEIYTHMKNDYRVAATYVDPGDHPNGINEKNFELDEEEADRILEVITEHYVSVQINEE